MTSMKIVVTGRNTELRNYASLTGARIFVGDDIRECLDIIKTVNPHLAIFGTDTSVEQIKEFITKSKLYVDIRVIVVARSLHQDIAKQYADAGAQVFEFEEGIESLFSNHNKKIPLQKQELDISSENNVFDAMAGKSDSFRRVVKMIELVAASHCNPVLIVGETGTGKELAAKAVHDLRHPKKPFIAVNCAAMTATLLESELFGHVKGAFTGAEKDKPGLIELSEDGTLFLDEVSEMPLDLQAKLLRVIQERCYRKVGGTQLVLCRATIIASSNRNLKSEVDEKRFRSDLYYRLNICPIVLEPLRSPSRKADIRFLAEHFVRTSTICPNKVGRISGLTSLALETLEKHQWPGNIRELKNVIDRAVLLETTDKIGLSSIFFEPAEYAEPEQTNNRIKDFSLANAEKELIAKALQETSWQKTRAATLLGITRATLYAKVRQYNIIGETEDSETGIPVLLEV